MILMTDKDWHLNKDENDLDGISHSLCYWLSHSCPEAYPIENNLRIERYLSIIDDPCAYCGSTCPVPLQGMYKMMTYL